MTFTIILPHRRNPGNDEALRICLDCLMANTINDFILLMDAAVDQPLYPRVNAMMQQATTEKVIYWSSDMFAAPGWDAFMLGMAASDTFVTAVLVEPGVIGLHPTSVQRDFGRRPETFDRAAFEAWCVGPANDLNLTGEGWYAPVLYPRTGFLAMGGLVDDDSGMHDHHGFTNADVALFERWKAAGNKVVRARNSYVYHLQRWSQVDEQEAAKRFS